MPEETQSPPPLISPTLGKHSRNWKKILLILLILGISVSLIGVGIYFIGTGDFQAPSSQKQATPSTKPKNGSTNQDERDMKIAFVRTVIYEPDKPLQTSILTINADGTQEKALVNFKNKVISTSSLSTNGNYLGWLTPDRLVQGIAAFSMEYVKISQTNKINRIFSSDKTVQDFVWSPDGKRIAILETGVQNPSTGITNSFAIKIFDIERNSIVGEFQGISNRSGDRLDRPSLPSKITWSKSADRVLAMYRSEGEYKIASYSTNSPILERIIYSFESKRGFPALTVFPDGSKITFIQEFKVGENYREELWMINVDGTNLRKIAILSENPCEFWLSGSISLDGSHTVMTGGCDMPPTHTVNKIVNLQEGNVTILPPKFSAGVWFTESKSLVIIDRNIAPNRLSLIGLSGKKLKEWIGNKEDVSQIISWSPSGKRLLISEGYPINKSFSILDFGKQKPKKLAEIKADGYNTHSPVWYFK